MGPVAAGIKQDASEHGSDRGGELQFWLALEEVTPEMGPMRFINKSHREGSLGSVLNQAGFRRSSWWCERLPGLG